MLRHVPISNNKDRYLPCISIPPLELFQILYYCMYLGFYITSLHKTSHNTKVAETINIVYNIIYK